MEILKHRLVDGGVQHLVCRKNSRKLSGSDMIVVHYTAGTSARTAAEFLAKEEVKASAHLVIGRQGELFQLVPFDTEAWHAGESEPLFYRHRVGQSGAFTVAGGTFRGGVRRGSRSGGCLCRRYG